MTVINLAEKRKERAKAHENDQVDQVAKGKAALVIQALQNGANAHGDGKIYIPIDGHVHEKSITPILNIVLESAGRDYDVVPMCVDGQLSDALGSWVGDYNFIFQFTPKKNVSAELPNSANDG